MTVEQYFEDKVDWKIYNYLLDCITELEDKDVYCELYIGTLLGKNDINEVYSYSSKSLHNGWSNRKELNEWIMNSYNSHGLYYCMCVCDENSENLAMDMNVKNRSI